MQSVARNELAKPGGGSEDDSEAEGERKLQ